MNGLDFEDLKTRIGEVVGVAEWVHLTQDMVNQFADLTEDHQFIHIDPEAAQQAGLDGTIVHGFYLLSLIPKFQYEVAPEITGVKSVLNYGLNKVRFIMPVPVGSRVRGKFTLKEVTERAPGQWLVTYEAIMEIEGQEKPAYVAETLGLFLT